MHPLRACRVRGALLALLMALAAADANALSIDTSDILGLHGDRLQEALDLIGESRAEAAEAVARRVIVTSPDSAAAQEILGVALALQDRVPEAIEALGRAIEVNPDQYTAWTKLGDIASALGDEEKAVGFYTRALAIEPEDRLSNQRVGLHLARHGQTEAAISHLEKGLVGAPADYLGVRVDLAALRLRAGQPERALDVLARWEEAAAAGAPVPPAALLLLGEARLATGEAVMAASRFRAILQDHADDIPALLGLGRAERALGNTSDSIAILARAADLAPDDPLPQLELAASEAEAGEGAAAQNRLDRLISPDRQPDVAVLTRAATLYGAMGRYEKARDSFGRAIEAAPDDPAVRAGMTAVLMRLGDTEAALKSARKRLELAPADADAAFTFGMLQEGSGDRTGAAASYEQALAQAPDHWPSLNNLAMLRLAENRMEEALDLALRANGAAPGNLVVLDTLADIYEAAGEADRAAETRYRMGEAYLAAGRIEGAREALMAAAAVASGPELRARIEQLLGSL